MKTISKIMMGLFIGMMMSLVFSSCAKENQNQQIIVNEQNIVGEWKISQIFITYYENGVEQATNEEQNFFDYYNLDFKSDGTVRVYFDEEVGQSPNPISWKIEKGKMIFKEDFQDRDDIEYVLDILELTKSSMILSNTHNEYEMDGIHYKSVNKIHFAKKHRHKDFLVDFLPAPDGIFLRQEEQHKLLQDYYFDQNIHQFFYNYNSFYLEDLKEM